MTGCRCIANTSGSGKTRRILESLTVYWGFYFVATPDGNGVGIRDLQYTLEGLTLNADWEDDLDIDDKDRAGRRRKSATNHRIATRAFRKVLAARIVAFELFLEAVIEVDKKLESKHKHYWLLFQLNLQAEFKNRHPVVQIMKDCLHGASNDALEQLIDRLPGICAKYIPATHFIVAVDEAQQAVRKYPHSFVSTTDDRKYRSVIREIANVFTAQPLEIKLVVSGTGVTMDDLRDSVASGVSKRSTVSLYHDLGMFDTWSKLKEFLKRYLPAKFLESPSGLRLQQRMREYLLGR